MESIRVEPKGLTDIAATALRLEATALRLEALSSWNPLG